jgi:translation initiation factor 1
MAKDWKDRLGVVYSTNTDYDYNSEKGEEQDTIPPRQQDLRVSLDRKNRKGKSVTLVCGFIGREEDLKELGKYLKSKCGVGGSVKEGEIIIQGDLREKVMDLLRSRDYRVKKSGG